MWLPVPHLLLVPFTLVASLDHRLWQAGLPGVLLSSICLGVTAAALYRVMRRMSLGSWWPVIAGLAVFVLNPTNLYLHTTAMTEPVLLAGIAMATSGISGFIASDRPLSGGEMAVYVGIPAAVAAGSRYDGWAFAAVALACIFVISFRRWHSWSYSLRVCAMTASPAGAIALWWMIINWVQYGDVLAFQRGPYSAQFLQSVFVDLGVLPTKGSLLVSLDTYAWAIWYVMGTVVLCATVAGLAVALVRDGVSARTAPMWLLAFAAPYYVATLVSGQSVIWHPMTSPPGLFNTRYAVPLLLVSALAVAYLLQVVSDGADERFLKGRVGDDRHIRFLWTTALPLVVMALVIVSYARPLSEPDQSVLGIEEARRMQIGNADLTTAVSYLRSVRQPSDRVLIDETENPALVRLGIGFDSIVARFSPDFEAQLRDPTADWVLCRSGSNPDDVCDAAAAEPLFAQHYSLAFTSGDQVVLQRVKEL